MTVEQMQALRDGGYTAAEVARLAGMSECWVRRRTETKVNGSRPARETWTWLYGQHEPVGVDETAAALGVGRFCAARRLRRLRQRGLAMTVGPGLWVAMDVPA